MLHGSSVAVLIDELNARVLLDEGQDMAHVRFKVVFDRDSIQDAMLVLPDVSRYSHIGRLPRRFPRPIIAGRLPMIVNVDNVAGRLAV